MEANKLLDTILAQIKIGSWEVTTIELDKGLVSRTNPDDRKYNQHHHSGHITVTIHLTDPTEQKRAKQFLSGDPTIK